VDSKVRKGFKEDGRTEKNPKIVGWDAAGVVAAAGPDVTLFKVGDSVMFAGVINRTGAYGQYALVDERCTGKKPSSLDWSQAASVPLTYITAWEAMTEQWGIPVPEEKSKSVVANKTLLVIAGAGGVGSIALQIAKRVLGFGRVIATASRQETIDWCKKKGADYTIDHGKAMLPQLAAIDGALANGVDYVLNCGETDQNWNDVVPTVGLFGKICNITGSSPDKPINVGPLFPKRATLTFELMFTRGLFGADLLRQHALLNRAADYIDAKTIEHNLTTTFSDFTAAEVSKAAALQDSGKTIGKTAVVVVKAAA